MLKMVEANRATLHILFSSANEEGFVFGIMHAHQRRCGRSGMKSKLSLQGVLLIFSVCVTNASSRTPTTRTAATRCFIPLTFLSPGGHLRESLNKVATGRAGASNAGPDASRVLCRKGIWERDLVYEGAVIAPEALASAPTVASFFNGGGAAALTAALAAAFPADNSCSALLRGGCTVAWVGRT